MLPLLLLLPAAVAAAHQIGKAFARADKQAIDRALADFIFAEGLPLRTVQSPFLRQFIQAVQKAPACVSDLLKMINKLVAVSDRQAVRLSYAAFRSKEGLFGEAEAHADAAAMPAHQCGAYMVQTTPSCRSWPSPCCLRCQVHAHVSATGPHMISFTTGGATGSHLHVRVT